MVKSSKKKNKFYLSGELGEKKENYFLRWESWGVLPA